MSNKALSIPDFFLPDSLLNRDTILRARMTIFLLICSAVMLSTAFTVAWFLGTMSEKQSRIVAVAALMQIAFLFLIKKTRNVEWNATIYFMITCFIITGESIFAAKSFLHTGLQVFPLILVFGFFTSPSRRNRLLLVACCLICSTICVVFVRRNGFYVPYAQDPDKFIDQLSLSALFKSILTVVCMYYYAKIKRSAQEDLEQELSWQHRQAKLDEIWRMVKSMFPELNGPLAVLSSDVAAVLKSQAMIEAEALERMDGQIHQMKQISQSIGWIYRAYRNETIDPSPLKQIQDQLTILLQRKLKHSSWSLRILPSSAGSQLQGPIPSAILLTLSILDHIMESAPAGKRPMISVRISEEAGQSVWTLSWDQGLFDTILKGTKAQELSAESLRLELIDDLIRVSGATVREFDNGKRHVIRIRGNWVVPA